MAIRIVLAGPIAVAAFISCNSSIISSTASYYSENYIPLTSTTAITATITAITTSIAITIAGSIIITTATAATTTISHLLPPPTTKGLVEARAPTPKETVRQHKTKQQTYQRAIRLRLRKEVAS